MNNVISEHKKMVAAIVKEGIEIVASIDPDKAHLWHMATGVAGESGELIDAVKKHVIYNKPLDVDNLIEELGDLEFYMEGIRACIGVSREEILEVNYHKLSKRYNGLKYSDEAAIRRADKE